MKTVMFLNFGTPKIINFPARTDGKLIIFDVPILEHITVVCFDESSALTFILFLFVCKICWAFSVGIHL